MTGQRPDAAADCSVCRKHRERGALVPGGPVGEDDLVLVSHMPGRPDRPAYPGTFSSNPCGTRRAFLKYNVIDMARQLEVEAGVPVAAPVTGGGEGDGGGDLRRPWPPGATRRSRTWAIPAS